MDNVLLLDFVFAVAGIVAGYMGVCGVWAAWLMHSARLAWQSNPTEWLRKTSGLEVRDSDVRLVATYRAVGKAEAITAPWIALSLNREVLVVESMVPWRFDERVGQLNLWLSGVR